MTMAKKIVVIAGPSGSGKNTIIRRIIERYPTAKQLVTATTRAPRAGEVDGVDYHFFTVERFDSETAAGHLVGTRFVPIFGGVHYGIYTPDLDLCLKNASVIFAPVDISGARYLKEVYGATTIFLVPESLEEYRSRIRARNPEMTEREFEERVRITDREMHVDAQEYDFRIVSANGSLEQSIEQIVEILRKEGYNLA